MFILIRANQGCGNIPTCFLAAISTCLEKGSAFNSKPDNKIPRCTIQLGLPIVMCCYIIMSPALHANHIMLPEL